MRDFSEDFYNDEESEKDLLVVSSLEIAEELELNHEEVFDTIQETIKLYPHTEDKESFCLCDYLDENDNEEKVYLLSANGAKLLFEVMKIDMDMIEDFLEYLYLKTEVILSDTPSYEYEDKVKRTIKWLDEQMDYVSLQLEFEEYMEEVDEELDRLHDDILPNKIDELNFKIKEVVALYDDMRQKYENINDTLFDSKDTLLIQNFNELCKLKDEVYGFSIEKVDTYDNACLLADEVEHIRKTIKLIQIYFNKY